MTIEQREQPREHINESLDMVTLEDLMQASSTSRDPGPQPKARHVDYKRSRSTGDISIPQQERVITPAPPGGFYLCMLAVLDEVPDEVSFDHD